MYQPPFHISNSMLMRVAAIAEKIGRISNYKDFETKPHLRRNNRIRSIHSSLAIEANSLSLDEVKGVIDGRIVLGPQREIQEVLNAYHAYEVIGYFDPYSVDDIKRLHGVMTHLTVQESGVFRSGNEGVFRGNQCIFMAPPPHLVPSQMEDLFAWMRAAANEVHPLILSSVFHYEFVFIHPFEDGNGRMARLWQTALLTKWNPIFQYLPLESYIHQSLADYYEAIGHFDPYSVDDIKRLHGIMTHLTVLESGILRSGTEGVFRGNQCIFMAPPPHLVPSQMDDLFAWMRAAKDEVHPLILSSVFHYEFVFIHPFADGNGRMARIWQTALLTKWNPIFQYLPLESHIHQSLADYYEAIAVCHSAGNADAFIEFMLDMIDSTLDWAQHQVNAEDAYLSEYVRKLLDVMEYDVPYTAAHILNALGLKSKENLRKHYLNPALENGLIVMGKPDKPTSRNQTYIRK